MNTRRVVLAFLVAPWAVPLVFLLWGFSEPLLKGRAAEAPIMAILLSGFYGLKFGYMAELAPGIVVWMVFRRFRISSWPAFLAAGAFMGWLVSLWLDRRSGNNPDMAIFCSALGALSTTVFRAIAGARITAPSPSPSEPRPSESAPRPPSDSLTNSRS